MGLASLLPRAARVRQLRRARQPVPQTPAPQQGSGTRLWMLHPHPPGRCHRERVRRSIPTAIAGLMFFFSNKMGCLGSLAVSVVGTLLLLLVLGVFNN